MGGTGHWGACRVGSLQLTTTRREEASSVLNCWGEVICVEPDMVYRVLGGRGMLAYMFNTKCPEILARVGWLVGAGQPWVRSVLQANTRTRRREPSRSACHDRQHRPD